MANSGVFALLRPVFASVAKQLVVKVDSATEYQLVSRTPSPFPQHKGHPMFFGAVKAGKAYVSVHLMPLYMCPPLQQRISPALKKRMQGKSCFHFKGEPEPELVAELTRLAEASLQEWAGKKWA